MNIDDPIYWMDNTSETVIDWWIAYYLLKDKPTKHSLTPSQALAQLNSVT